MFINIFNSAKAHIKGGRKYPKIDGIVTFKETKNGVLVSAKINVLVNFLDFTFMKELLVVEI